MMKTKPILFQSEMIRALLDGRKTQTRRLLKVDTPDKKKAIITSPREEIIEFEDGTFHYRSTGGLSGPYPCPYGKLGDLLWVRESWKPEVDNQYSGIQYKADNTFIVIENTPEAADKWVDVRRSEEQWPKMEPAKWRPSIHMPRWASRLTLKITSVRVERVQDISETDAAKEGVYIEYFTPDPSGLCNLYRVGFKELWQKINGNWDQNPWAWVIEFEVIRENVDKILNGNDQSR